MEHRPDSSDYGRLIAPFVCLKGDSFVFFQSTIDRNPSLVRPLVTLSRGRRGKRSTNIHARSQAFVARLLIIALLLEEMRISATEIVTSPLFDTTVTPSGVEHGVVHARAAHLTALPSVLWMVAHAPHSVTPMLTDTHSMLELPHSAHSCSLAQNERDPHVQQRPIFRKRWVKKQRKHLRNNNKGTQQSQPT